MKYFVIGLILAIISVLVSIILWGLDNSYYLTSIFGLILLGLCAIFSGAMSSGKELQANYATESSQERQNRFRFAMNTLFIALPNLAVAVGLYYLISKGLL